MRRFERQPDGGYLALVEPEEAQLLQSLAQQITEMLGGEDPEAGPTGPLDPAVKRLLPDAYPGDAEASAEFRRFTASGLIDRKTRNAHAVIASLELAVSSGEIVLDEAGAAAWLRTLTDIRLVVAARLGIETDDDESRDDLDPLMRDIYDWLGFIQNSLVEALDA